MATAIMNYPLENRVHQSAANMDHNNETESELIEAKSKDAEGRIIVHRYMKGKLLGKVLKDSADFSYAPYQIFMWSNTVWRSD